MGKRREEEMGNVPPFLLPAQINGKDIMSQPGT
jgi:hypothetical protein